MGRSTYRSFWKDIFQGAKKKKAQLQGWAGKTTEKSHPFVVLLTIGVFKSEKAKSVLSPDTR